jgi:hypothetical protein
MVIRTSPVFRRGCCIVVNTWEAARADDAVSRHCRRHQPQLYQGVIT